MRRPIRFLTSFIGMNRYPAWRLWLCCPLCIFAQTVEPTVNISGFGNQLSLRRWNWWNSIRYPGIAGN